MTTTETLAQESPFFVVRTAREASEALANTVSEYNDRYVKKTLEKGKEFKEGLRKDAVLLVDRLIERKEAGNPDDASAQTESGSEMQAEVKSEMQAEANSDAKAEDKSEFSLLKIAHDKANALTETFNGYSEKYVEKPLERGMAFTEALQKDAWLLADRLLEKGKALLSLKPLEENITHSVKTVVEKMGLPSREDIEALNETMDALSTRVDALDKKDDE